MNCKVDCCKRDAVYKQQQVCQMHYFRFMRNGTYSLTRTRKKRIENPAGYQKIYLPGHPLANSDSYAYEHRVVVYSKHGEALPDCPGCGKKITWENCHIDHIDCDVKNNNPSNLRPVCRGCNVFRGHSATSMGKLFLTINGKTMSAQRWAREPGVAVSGATIRRRKKFGASDYDAVYAAKITHKKTTPKPQKVVIRNDEWMDGQRWLETGEI